MLQFLQRRITSHNGIEIDFSKGNIGAGICFLHAYNITINYGALIGEDCVFFKGSTVGSIRSGKKTGVPQIGDKVVVGCNAMICGGISVGKNSLISANSFVNFNVPENSIVIGNPGVIHHKENAVVDYI